ncbi:MAG: hypothetical protein IPM56_13990 [Ignavibacteriales bacterium]|nr:MAG: hypothetical protein IPM56_13990 [Ignavibacteriales bacterium]
MPLPTIRQLVRFLPRGSNNPITAREIAEHFNVSDEGVEVPIRAVIRTAIEEGELIGSNTNGFFRITTQDEYDSYLESLRRRQRGIGARIRNLQNNWENR